jgi:hypothetical protein
MAKCKALSTPSEVNPECDDDSAELSVYQQRQFRSVLGKAIWTLPERPDTAYCVKELSRLLGNMNEHAWVRAKHLLRYLQGTRGAYLRLGGGFEKVNEVSVFSDSNWAAGPTRRSTSGGCIFVHGCLITSWARTQPSIALSSCEAEVVALSEAAKEAILVRNVLKEIGFDYCIVAYVDSSSARALCLKRGVGRMKHLDTRFLWLQDLVRDKQLTVEKIATLVNPADVPTSTCHVRGTRR